MFIQLCNINYFRKHFTYLKKSVFLLTVSHLLHKMSSTCSPQSNLIAVCQMTAINDKDFNFKVTSDLITSAAKAGAKIKTINTVNKRLIQDNTNIARDKHGQNNETRSLAITTKNSFSTNQDRDENCKEKNMVFLPEAFDFVGENKEQTFNLAETMDGPILKKIKHLAIINDIWVSLGGMHIKREGSKLLSNCHLVINNLGDIVAAYDKVHLFDVDIPEKKIHLKESAIIEKGNIIPPPLDSPVGKIGLAICYDLRFPELSLMQASQGAQLLTYPSAFTYATGSAHWEPLLKSRAIENQCYVVAAAQTGVHNSKRSSWGHAMVVDPSGLVVAQCSEGTGFAVAHIDLELVKATRAMIPVWRNRRYDLYPRLASHPETKPLSAGPAHLYTFGQVQVKEEQVFYRTELSFAFTNKCCVVPGHVLVAPLRLVRRMHELTKEEVADLFQAVQRVETVMESVHMTSSTTVSVQDGPLAGQTIEHVHVHILPRTPGDFSENDEIYQVLQKHDKGDMTKKWRTDEEMAAEAKALRKYFL